MKFSHLTGLAAVTAAAILAPAGAARAQDAPPVPGCQGVQLADKKGDNSQPSTDITNVFLRTDGGKTTLNMQLNNLSAEIPSGSTHWYWRVDYETADGGFFRLQAMLRSDGSTGFKVRERAFAVPGVASVYTDVGTVPGKLVLGKDGVVQWELSDAIGATAGNKILNLFASADEVTAGEPYQGTGYLRVVDSIDDTTDVPSKEYEVKECEAGSTPPPADPNTPPTDPNTPPPSQEPAPPPSSEPTPPPSSNPPQSSGGAAPKKQSKAKSCKAKAKKIKNKKKRAKAMKRCKKKSKRR